MDSKLKAIGNSLYERIVKNPLTTALGIVMVGVGISIAINVDWANVEVKDAVGLCTALGGMFSILSKSS